MPQQNETTISQNPPAQQRPTKLATLGGDAQFRRFLYGILILTGAMFLPLFNLFRFAIGDDMYSYMVLMPIVTAYLINLKKPWQITATPPTKIAGLILLVISFVLAATCLYLLKTDFGLEREESLALSTMAYLAGLAGVSVMTLGWSRLKACAFPLCMLVFLIPMPAMMFDSIVEFLQYGSAYVADAMFHMVGTTATLNDLSFDLPPTPGIHVAPECSGIHSTYILLITSLLAGYLFLRSPKRRVILTLAVLPLAFLRNGFRIFTIGELCVHYGMQMIDSWIHHKGGPFFFALSLIPFFLLLVWLRSRDRSRDTVLTATK